jgi:hypothetical protein
MRLKQELQARFEIELKARTDAARNQYIMEKFNEINAAMQAAIGKSYPESVLKELAQFTANCLSVKYNVNPDGSISIDPAQCLTAAEGYQKITDLFLFSDWSSGQ